MSFGLFESIDLDTSFQRTASRKALALANKRAQNQFGAFLNVSAQEKNARFALINSDLQKLVIAACRECGHDDPESVYHSVADHLGQHIAAPRRPKMCPYHRELTDMSLTLGDPKSAFEMLTSHQFGPASCRGSNEGTCNWTPEMVTQSYWDNRQQEADQRAEQRGLQPQQMTPPLDGGTDLVAPEEVPDYQGPDINDALDVAPSAVGAPEPVMAGKQSWNFDNKKGDDVPDEEGDDDGHEPDDDDSEDFNKDKKAKKKKEYQEGNVCSSCGNGSCSGCSGGGCSCGGCGGGTTASLKASDKEHWIQDAVKKPGQLHKDLGVPKGEKIPEEKLEEAEHSDNPKERERAQFAENMKGLHHGADVGDPYSYAPYNIEEIMDRNRDTGGLPSSSEYGAPHMNTPEWCPSCGLSHQGPGRYCPDCDPNSQQEGFQGLMEEPYGVHMGAMPEYDEQGYGDRHDTTPNFDEFRDHPNYFDPFGEEEDLDELIQALALEHPGLPYEQLLALAQQESQGGMPELHIDPQAMNQDYGEPMYSSVHESIKADRNGDDSIVEHMDFPKQNGQDTATGLSTDPPVKMDPKTWAPHNMPKLDVDKPNGMHNTVTQDITEPTHYKGDAWDKDDGRFDSFKNPTRTDTLPSAGDDETRLGDSGFAGNNMDDPQSTSDVWNGMENQHNPVTDSAGATINGPVVSHISEAELLRALAAFKR